jgi:serine protease inhibitor
MQHRNLVRTGLSAALITITACRGDLPTQPPLEPIRGLTANETQVVVRSTNFGMRLMQEIAANEGRPNIMISPLSASVALGMAMNGAAGDTYAAMRDVLDFSGMSNDEINEAYRGLIAQLRSRDPKVEFHLANSVWHEATFPVQPAFLDVQRRIFDAEVEALDFRSSAAVATINSWVANATQNRIRDLIDRIEPEDMMFLINAVYFKAGWTQPFQPQATAPRAFRTQAGTSVQAPTMMQDAQLLHFTGDGVMALELLYEDSAYSMVLVAPERADAPLSELIDRLSPATWASWLDRMQRGRVMVFMPKFKFEYDAQLKAPLAQLGMGIAFVPRVADFSRINTTRDDLHISSVIQKTYIDVHELGTEAAAVTSVTVGITSMPPSLEFNRPFLFAIRERSTGTLMFVGRIGDPTR